MGCRSCHLPLWAAALGLHSFIASLQDKGCSSRQDSGPYLETLTFQLLCLCGSKLLFVPFMWKIRRCSPSFAPPRLLLATSKNWQVQGAESSPRRHLTACVLLFSLDTLVISSECSDFLRWDLFVGRAVLLVLRLIYKKIDLQQVS